jgi:hypothetical protein
MKDESVKDVKESVRACSKVVSQHSYSVLETTESFSFKCTQIYRNQQIK